MIYIEKLNAVYTHCPKTAGTFVRRALVVAGIGARAVGREHDDADEAEKMFPGALILTTVRDPLNWYRSYFADRQFVGWGGDLVIGHDCQAATFQEFIDLVLEKHPKFLGELYTRFGGGLRFAVEHLPGNLALYLFKCGLNPDRHAMATLPKINQCASLLPDNGELMYCPVIETRTRLQNLDPQAWAHWKDGR